MKYYNSCMVAAMTVLWLLMAASAEPVRRSPDLEARRRSAIDRSMIRLGRSYPAEPSAAEIREAFEPPSRRGNSFLRLGRSQPLILTSDDVYNLLRSYENDDQDIKRAPAFVRLGRDPKFIRFGRSADDNKETIEINPEMAVNEYPLRKGRARDHFIRLGRDNEELNDDGEERRKRSTVTV